MVKRGKTMSSSKKGANSAGSSKRYSSPITTVTNDNHEDLRKDALVMAVAMAGAEALEGRSPTQQNIEEANQREGSTSSPTGHPFNNNDYHNNKTGSNRRGAKPPSPMVTPPIHSYNTAATSLRSSSASNKATSTRSKETAAAVGAPSAGIPHVYHDYSQVPDVIDFVRKKTGGVTQPFPEKLHEMLQAVEGTADTDIVSWLPHGRAFIVRKPKEFTDQIMPRHFKQTKLTSFQRQLNLYGFRRITQGTDAGAYYHEMFLRARPALCQRMARQKVKGTGHKQPADAKTEPNFYLMRPVEPVPSPQGTPHNFGGGISTTTTATASIQYEQQQQQQNDQASRLFSPPEPMRASYEPRSMRSHGAAPPSAAPTTVINNQISPPPPTRPTISSTVLLESPASPGLHGAAHLLQGMASGTLRMMPIDTAMMGSSAVQEGNNSNKDNDNNDDDDNNNNNGDPSSSQQHQETPTSFLQPRLSSIEKRSI